MSRDQHEHDSDDVRSHADSDTPAEPRESDDQPGPRDVVVPMEVYKVVTVFSTLIAVPAVVLGFMFLDAATLQVSFMRRIVLTILSAVGLVPDSAVLSAVLAIVGLLLIALGAGVYVLGARFRAEGMGNAEEDANEQSTNG